MKSRQTYRASRLVPVFAKRCHLILSVDDEPSVLYTRLRILQDAGYDVLNAGCGEQALHLFNAFPVDLVLLDYVMPGINGAVVAQEMRHRKGHVPIILVSAFMPEGILALVDGFVEKGNGPLPLLEIIRRQLRSSAGKKLPA